VRVPAERFREMEAIIQHGGAAVLLDLEPLLGVRIAAAVSRQQLAHVVLVLPRWPHADAVLPAHDLVAGLVQTSRYLREPNVTSNVVFVLDADRQTSTRRPATDGRVDNRYSLAAGDLPDLATLRRAGIRRVIRLVQPR
jgi:hypothetical protein